MHPTDFPESNLSFIPPKDLTEEQCKTIRGYVGRIQGGSVDGAQVIVTAWLPSPEELAALNAGKPIFLSTLGAGLSPHFLTVDFYQATHPA